ncbi:MAG: TM0106 family RecB-like putative nuclease [Chloroflexaceae bacterium]|nr:TM0106 family RecB-like putative nuclease [Chloroflexaceae bacterium]
MLLTDELLLHYKRCQRRAFLDLHRQHQQDPEREFQQKLRQESRAHAASFLAKSYPHHHHLASSEELHDQAQATETLMQQGVDCIHRGTILSRWPTPLDSPNPVPEITLAAKPDLLVKYPGKSRFGDWHYSSVSIQYGRRPKPEYKLIAAYQGYLLSTVQQTKARTAQIILRGHDRYLVNLSTWLPRLQEILQACIQSLLATTAPEVFISRQRCNLCHWYSHCYAIAQTEKHLSLVPGVTPQRYEYLQDLGITTVESLSEACPMYLGELLGFGVACQLQRQARSLVENRPLLRNESLTPPPLPAAQIELYFDIEAEPERQVDYLLGILTVDRQTGKQQYHPFLARDPEGEAQIWQEFLALVGKYEDAPIYHYSEYETETLRRLGALYQTPRVVIEGLLARCIDLHHRVVSTTVLPVESYSLKSLANWLGFQWRDPNASGEQSVCWYDKWLKERDISYLEAILRYNEDDCQATYRLKDWLASFYQELAAPTVPSDR